MLKPRVSPNFDDRDRRVLFEILFEDPQRTHLGTSRMLASKPYSIAVPRANYAEVQRSTEAEPNSAGPDLRTLSSANNK